MEEIVQVLACFYEATVELSGSKYVTLSMVLPIFESLKTEITLSKEDIPLTRVLKKFLFYWVNFYSQKYKIYENKFYITSTFLDIRTKNFTRFSAENRKIYDQC